MGIASTRYTKVNMIKQIRGTVVGISDHLVIVDVGGIGYGIHTPHNTTQFLLDDSVCFHTHLAVRENALDLYGFIDLESLRIFGLLIELPKIGPKSALQILSQADVSLLQEAVSKNDAGYLSKLSGIGKKSAEKIVVGLKDKFEMMDYSSPISNDHTSDTIDALIALGYSPEEARRTIRQILETDSTEVTSSTETLKKAIRILSR